MVAALAVVFWPRRGVYARFAHVARLTERVRLEDALKHVYTWEQAGRVTTLESLAGRLEISTVRSAKLLQRLTELGLVHAGDESPSLSEDGRDAALRVVAELRVPAGGVTVEFTEVRVTVDTRIRRALATVTAALTAGAAFGGEGLEMRELDMVFSEIGGEWIVEQVRPAGM